MIPEPAPDRPRRTGPEPPAVKAARFRAAADQFARCGAPLAARRYAEWADEIERAAAETASPPPRPEGGRP